MTFAAYGKLSKASVERSKSKWLHTLATITRLAELWQCDLQVVLVAGRDLNLFGPELWVAPNQSAAISAKQISGPCNQLDAAFESLVQQRIGALLVGSGAFVFGRRDRLGALAASYAIPAIYDLRDYVAASGLISYGVNITRAYCQVGIHVGQILNGAKPAELPVIEAANVELVLNLKTAKTLGLTIPPSTLGRADEVIE